MTLNSNSKKTDFFEKLSHFLDKFSSKIKIYNL